jgi:hypothetical protein
LAIKFVDANHVTQGMDLEGGWKEETTSAFHIQQVK